jgi:hypothetical protein
MIAAASPITATTVAQPGNDRIDVAIGPISAGIDHANVHSTDLFRSPLIFFDHFKNTKLDRMIRS